MPLCAICDNFDIQRLRTSLNETISIRYSIVKENSKLGCDFCSILLEGAQHHLNDFDTATSKHRGDADAPWIRLSVDGEYEEQAGKTANCKKLNVLICNYQYLDDYNEISSLSSTDDINFDLSSTGEFYLVASQESSAYKSQVISGRYVGLNRSSSEFAAAIRQWVDNCIMNHTSKCCVTVSGKESISPQNVRLPSRCIDVGRPDHSYLAECSGKRGSYIVLSHRWTSETQGSKTTSQNYSPRKLDLDLSQLPAIFRYAITLARELGVQYVWIDSICILQDDSADLRKELLNMAQYYQNALFTLAAEVNPESNQEISSVPKPFNRLAQLPYRDAGKWRGYFYLFQQKWKTEAQYLAEVDQSELLSRGWVFQEWFLSARIVHLAPSNTFLECRTQSPRSVGNQDVRAPYEVRNMPKIFNKQKLLPHQFGFKSQFYSGSELSLDVWYELAQTYSRLNLTKASDHLNAIAGIATEFTKVMTGLPFPEAAMNLVQGTWHSAYASGLWLPDIHYGLLWRGASEMLKLCDCGAPSWSWLALEGQVTWPERHPLTVNHVEILSIIRDVEQNPASYLITMADMLHIKGKIQPVLACGRMGAALDRDLAVMTGDKIYARGIKAFGGDTNEAASKHQGHQVRQLICPTTAPTVAGGWGTFERSASLQLRADGESYLVHALHVSTRNKVDFLHMDDSSVSEYEHSVMDVLFVEPVAGTPDQFRRIGVGAFHEPLIKESYEEIEAMDILLV